LAPARGYAGDVRTALLLLACAPVIASCAPGDGMRFQVINMERPTEDVGLPPPSDYTPCYTGEARGYDNNGDGKIDEIRVSVQGKERCYGEDTNHDGVIDTWDVMDESGQLQKRAHDSNGDRRVDQSWTFDPTQHGCATVLLDRDNDGIIDPGSPLRICQNLAGSPARPAQTPDGGH
jgi:hypothetical protein